MKIYIFLWQFSSFWFQVRANKSIINVVWSERMPYIRYHIVNFWWPWCHSTRQSGQPNGIACVSSHPITYIWIGSRTTIHKSPVERKTWWRWYKNKALTNDVIHIMPEIDNYVVTSRNRDENGFLNNKWELRWNLYGIDEWNMSVRSAANMVQFNLATK